MGRGFAVDAHVPQCAGVGELMRNASIYRILLIGALWLPATFFLWFFYRAQFAWPVVQLAKAALLHLWPELYLDVLPGGDQINPNTGELIHHADWITINSNVLYNAVKDGAPKFAFYDFSFNPMQYGYSLPLFAILVMATPLEKSRRLMQIGVGLIVLWPAQAFGVVAEAFKSFLEIPEGVAKMHELGYSLEVIVFCYQFGYLILPPLVPAVLWVLFNRSFIEELTRPPGEPKHQPAVETPQQGE
jgi:hypothetical protein